MKLSEYSGYDALGLAELVSKKETSPSELLDAALSAVAELNPILNAVVSTFEDDARRTIAAKLPEGPFRGVPFMIKDLLAQYEGQPTGSGWPPRYAFKAKSDSELVRRYKAAGLVIFGKTAVPELAWGWSTESSAHGATANPWDRDLTAGTSSGGAAASVASGIVPMAHGNDAGGSIRVPASCCGCFGLKPSRGRNPTAPAGDIWQGQFVEHAITRSVRDSAALLDATAGQTLGQFYNSAPGGAFLPEVGQQPGRLKIAVSTKAPYGAPTHEDCIEAVQGATDLLADLGHICEPHDIDLPPDGFDAFRTFFLAEFAAEMRLEERQLKRKLSAADFRPVHWEMLEAGRRIDAADYCVAVGRIQHVCQRVASTFGKYDAYLSPTLAKPPVKLGTFPYDVSLEEHLSAYLSWMPFTHIFNISGSPAMSVPLHWNKAGLPIGVQFAAAPGNEAVLFRLAGQLEAAAPWANKKPNISIS